MRRVGISLLLAALAACSDAPGPAPAAPPPGPLDARAAALADEIGRILGEPFEGLPAVEVRPMEEIRQHLTTDLGAWCPLPGDAPHQGVLLLMGVHGLEPLAFALPGEDRILVAKELADGAPEEADRALARALAAIWCGRRLRLPDLARASSLPERWARAAATRSLTAVAERRLREARGESEPETTRSAPTTEDLRELGPLFARSWRSGRAEVSAAEAAFARFAAVTVDRLGLAGACREVGRRPPSTYREILRPEDYLAGTVLDDPAAESAARVSAILEGGLEFLGATPVYPEVLAAVLGRDTAPDGFVGGVELAGSSPGTAVAFGLLLFGETPTATRTIRDGLLAAERAADEEWDWLSTEEAPLDGGVLFRRRGGGAGIYATEETVVLARGRLVLRLRLSSPEDFLTDAAGLGRRILSRALDVPVPDPEPWELRWRELGRAARYAEALADPDLRIRRRAAARRDAMADPKRTPWAAFRLAAGEPDPVLRASLLEALSLRAIRGPDPAAEVSEIVLRGLLDADPGVRIAAARAIECADWTKAPVVAAVTRALADPLLPVRRAARSSIISGAMEGGPMMAPDSAWAGAVIESLDDEEPMFRAEAATTLGMMPEATPEIRAALEAHADDEDAEVREAVAKAKQALGIP